MLPYRLNISLFTAALSACCLLAPIAVGQSFQSATTSPTQFQDNQTVGGTLKLGPATIDLTQKSSTERLELGPDFSRFREDTSDAKFTLNLGDQDRFALFPESLSLTRHTSDFFGHPQFSIGTSSYGDSDDWSESDYILSADWGSSEDKYTFSFSTRTLSDQPQNGAPVTESDDMLNFTRTMKTGSWLSSFTASVGRGYRDDSGGRELSRRFGASANFRTAEKGALNFDFTARVLQDRTTQLTPGTRDIDTKWELRTGTRLFGGLDREPLAVQPSLSIFFSVKGNSPDAEEENVKPVDVSAGVTGKVHF